MNIDISKAERIGENVSYLKQEGKIFLVIDENVDIGPSSSGKMTGIASTGGFTKFSGLSLNLYLGKKN